MKNLRVALFLYIGLTGAALAAGSDVGPPNQIVCNHTATFSGVAANTIIVPAVAGATVFICGWDVTSTSATTTTFLLTTGTKVSTNCDTGTITLTPAMNVTLTAPVVDHINFAGVSSAVGQALCVTPSATSVAGIVWYSQF